MRALGNASFGSQAQGPRTRCGTCQGAILHPGKPCAYRCPDKKKDLKEKIYPTLFQTSNGRQLSEMSRGTTPGKNRSTVLRRAGKPTLISVSAPCLLRCPRNQGWPTPPPLVASLVASLAGS